MKTKSLKINTLPPKPLATFIEILFIQFSKRLRTLFVLGLLIIIGLNLNAQTFQVEVNNTAPTSCDWIIDIYGNSGTLIQSISSSGSSGLVNWGCQSGVVDSIIVNENYGGSCSTIIFFASSGNIPYSSIAPTCVNPCSSAITCAGGTGSMACTPPAASYLIEIKP